MAAQTPAPRAIARPTHLGTLTESRLGPEPGPGAGREIWLILGRCFLGSQGSRAQSRRRGGLGSCSIRPAGPRHHGRSRQPPGLPQRWPGPRRMCRLRAGAEPRPPITQGLWFPRPRPTPLPRSLPLSSPSPSPEGCPLALHPHPPCGPIKGKPHGNSAAKEQIGTQQAETGTQHVERDKEGHPTGRGRHPTCKGR